MSFVSDTIAALVTLCADALPPEYEILNHYVFATETDVDVLPRCMVHSPSSAGERLDYQQTEETLSIEITLLRKRGEGLEMRQDVEAIYTKLNTDERLLTGMRDDFLGAWSVNEAGQTQVVGSLTYSGTRVD